MVSETKIIAVILQSRSVQAAQSAQKAIVDACELAFPGSRKRREMTWNTTSAKRT